MGRTSVEAGPGASRTPSPLQCAGNDDPLQGPVEVKKYQERMSKPSEAAWAGRDTVPSHCCLVRIHTWAFLPSSVQSASLNPRCPACVRKFQGKRWTWSRQGWCGATSPKSCLQEAASADHVFSVSISPHPVLSCHGHAFLPSCWGLPWASEARVPSVPAPLGTAQGSVAWPLHQASDREPLVVLGKVFLLPPLSSHLLAPYL